jgi:beta-lactamase regulating signal transducer with metallopeptidase domain
VNIALGVFYIFYWLLLQKDTFYLWKRYYFLAALFLSLLFPLVDFSGFFSPVQVQTIQQITPLFPINVSGANKGFSMQDGILLAIIIGSIVLLVRMGIQLISLWKIHSKSTPDENFNDCKIRKMYTITNPFSFFRTIYINPALNDEDLKAILNHEQIHVSQWHSIDIMLFETICALCWYNPLVWLLRHAMRQNIEFYTDKQILEAGYDRRQYQQELLKVSQIPTYLKIANNFNFNHLKKRITMMNKKKSNRMQLLKFALVVPLFAGMTVLANNNVSLINQDTKLTVEVKNSNAGKFAVDKSTHDFKTIKEKDGKVTAIFTFTNNTDKPVVITNVKPSCGCTTPEWTKEPIAPEKQGHVKATYDPAGRPGPFDKTITVETSGDPSSIELRIKGSVDIN